MSYTTESWLRSCLRKKVYKTQKFAEAVAKNAAKNLKKPMRVYFCRDCHNYHLTSKEER